MSLERPIDLIFARRSIRAYTDEPLIDEEIDLLLKAAMAAPSASNIKPWHFVVIRDPARLQALADLHPHGKMLARAALAVAVCGVPGESRYWVQDCSAATENLLLAATALGLGAVWLGVHPRPEREGPIGEALGVPAGVGVLCLIAIGNPAEEKPARTQYDPARVHSETF